MGGRFILAAGRERVKTDVRESTSELHDLGLSRSAYALCVSCVCSACMCVSCAHGGIKDVEKYIKRHQHAAETEAANMQFARPTCG